MKRRIHDLQVFFFFKFSILSFFTRKTALKFSDRLTSKDQENMCAVWNTDWYSI